MTGKPSSCCSALCRAVRTSRPMGLSPAIGSSVRSRMTTFFLPANAATTAASGNRRKTLMWRETTFAPPRAEETTLARRRTVDQIVGRAQVRANQLRLVLVKRPLEMGREEAVHHVHSGRETQLGDTPQDQRLVGGLLGVLSEDDDPARV